jgi:hypothetical protein
LLAVPRSGTGSKPPLFYFYEKISALPTENYNTVLKNKKAEGQRSAFPRQTGV